MHCLRSFCISRDYDRAWEKGKAVSQDPIAGGLAGESHKAGQRPHNSISFIDIRKQAKLELAVRNQQSHDIWGTLEHLTSLGESRGRKWLTMFQ